MTVLHATEAPTVYLSLWARVDGLTRRRRRPGAVRRPHAWSSSSRCGAPSSSSRATCCRRRGGARRPGSPRRTGARLAKEVESGGLADDGAAWLDAAEARRRSPGSPDGAELSAQQLREQVPELAGRHRDVAGQVLRRQRLDRAAGAHPARRRGQDRPRPQRRPLAHRPAAVDARWTTWLGRGARARQGARGVRRAGPPLAARPSAPAPRPTSSGGWARPRPPYAPRWPTSAPSRSASTAERPAGCCPTTSSRSAAGRARGRRCCRCSTRP